MVARSIDLTPSRADIISSLLPYIHGDTLCYQQEYPENLFKAQQTSWEPILKWLELKFNIELNRTYQISSIHQSSHVVHVFQKEMEAMSNLNLIGKFNWKFTILFLYLFFYMSTSSLLYLNSFIHVMYETLSFLISI